MKPFNRDSAVGSVPPVLRGLRPQSRLKAAPTESAPDLIDSIPVGAAFSRDRVRSTRPLAWCALAAAITLAGCAGLPDQRLANEALKRGDTATAERNFKALADLGYSDAQVGLADLNVATRDPAKLKEAEATYRAAAAASPAPRPASAACWWPSPTAPRPNAKKPRPCSSARRNKARATP